MKIRAALLTASLLLAGLLPLHADEGEGIAEGGTGTPTLTLQLNGTKIGKSSTLNLIQGSGTSLAAVYNSLLKKFNVTITATAQGMTPNATFYANIDPSAQQSGTVNVSNFITRVFIASNTGTGFGSTTNTLTISPQNSSFAPYGTTIDQLGGALWLRSLTSGANQAYLNLNASARSATFTFDTLSNAMQITPAGVYMPEILVGVLGTGTTQLLGRGPRAWTAGDYIDLDFDGMYTFASTTQHLAIGRVRALVDGTNGGSGAPYGGLQIWGSRLAGPASLALLSVKGSNASAFDTTTPDKVIIGPGSDPGFTNNQLPIALLFAVGYGSTGTVTYSAVTNIFTFDKTIESTFGVHAATGVFDTSLTVAGQNVCRENGVNCPPTGSSGSAPTLGIYLGGVEISSPTSQVNFSSSVFVITQSPTGQANVSLKLSSVTALGNAIDLGGTEVAGILGVTNGGTGASSASGARTALGLVIGTDVLAPTGDGSGLTGLTKSQVGLGNVDNTSDANKPVSTAQQAAIDAKISHISTGTTGSLPISRLSITGTPDGTKFLRDDGAWATPPGSSGPGTFWFKRDGTTLDAAVSTINVVGVDFAATSSPAGQVNITISTNITRMTDWNTLAKIEAIVGLDVLTSTEGLTQSSATATYLQNSSATATYLNIVTAAATYLTQSSATATYLQSSSATATYLQNSSATAVYLQKNDAAATYATIASLASYLTTASAASTYLTQSSATATYLQSSSATLTYLNKTDAALLYQPLDSDLTALAGMSSNGILARTGTGAISARTLTAGSTYVTLTNGDGVSGNPTIDVAGLVKTTDINSVAKLEVILGANVMTSTETAANATLWGGFAVPSATGPLYRNSNATISTAAIPTTDLSGTLQAAQEPAHTGDVTNSAGSLALVIGNDKVTGAMIALGSDASGDIMYHNGTDYVRLPKGSNTQVLTLASGVPSWATPSNGPWTNGTSSTSLSMGGFDLTGGATIYTSSFSVTGATETHNGVTYIFPPLANVGSSTSPRLLLWNPVTKQITLPDALFTVSPSTGIDAGTLATNVLASAMQSGTNPTITTVGFFGVDTSSRQFVFNDGTNAIVLPSTQTKTMTIETPTLGDFPFFWRAESDQTVQAINCISSAATSTAIRVQKCNADGGSCTDIEAAITCGTTNTAVAGAQLDSASITAGSRMRVLVGAVSGTPGWVSVDVTYLETRK